MLWPFVKELQRTQSQSDGTTCRPDRRWQSTDQTHDQRKKDSPKEQRRSYTESKRQVGEGLPVHGASRESVQRQHGYATERPAQGRNEQRFDQKEHDDACITKAAA